MIKGRLSEIRKWAYLNDLINATGGLEMNKSFDDIFEINYTGDNTILEIRETEKMLYVECSEGSKIPTDLDYNGKGYCLIFVDYTQGGIYVAGYKQIDD